MLRTLAARALAGATASSSSSSASAATTAASIVVGASSSPSWCLFPSRSYAAGISKSKSTNNDADYGLAAGVSEELLNREVGEGERDAIEPRTNEQKSNCSRPSFFPLNRTASPLLTSQLSLSLSPGQSRGG
jgi:hypothetical protein